MRRLASALVLATLAAAAPAAAQIVGRHDYGPSAAPNPFLEGAFPSGPGIGSEVGGLRDEIDRAHASGSISGREARRLDRQARRIGALARRYGRDGLSGSELHELRTRALILQADLNRPRPAASANRTRRGRS
jgi:hypothetical protein